MILVALKEVQCWCFKSSPRDCVSSRILLDYQLNPRNTKMPPSLNIALFGFVWLLSNVFWGKFVREEISDEDNLRKSQWHRNWSALILERLRHRLICFCFCCKYLKQGSDPFLRHKLSFSHHANGHKANHKMPSLVLASLGVLHLALGFAAVPDHRLGMVACKMGFFWPIQLFKQDWVWQLATPRISSATSHLLAGKWRWVTAGT